MCFLEGSFTGVLSVSTPVALSNSCPARLPQEEEPAALTAGLPPAPSEPAVGLKAGRLGARPRVPLPAPGAPTQVGGLTAGVSLGISESGGSGQGGAGSEASALRRRFSARVVPRTLRLVVPPRGVTLALAGLFPPSGQS